jgi:hypothetical protein
MSGVKKLHASAGDFTGENVKASAYEIQTEHYLSA